MDGVMQKLHMEEMGFREIGATTFLAPLPAVLLSCRGTEPGYDRDNLITIAWTGVVNSHPPMISVSIRPQRHSYSQILQSGVFCVNLIGKDLCKAADFCGVKSGRDVDKFEALGLRKLELPEFGAVALADAPVILRCRVQQRIALGSHDLFLCAVEGCHVREDLFAPDGSIDVSSAELVAYAHGSYFPLEKEAQGFFGYSVAKPEVAAKRMGLGNRKRAPKQT